MIWDEGDDLMAVKYTQETGTLPVILPVFFQLEVISSSEVQLNIIRTLHEVGNDHSTYFLVFG